MFAESQVQNPQIKLHYSHSDEADEEATALLCRHQKQLCHMNNGISFSISVRIELPIGQFLLFFCISNILV
jgi:hypothetical protein